MREHAPDMAGPRSLSLFFRRLHLSPYFTGRVGPRVYVHIPLTAREFVCLLSGQRALAFYRENSRIALCR